jgi:hypothetical protein
MLLVLGSLPDADAACITLDTSFFLFFPVWHLPAPAGRSGFSFGLGRVIKHLLQLCAPSTGWAR